MGWPAMDLKYRFQWTFPILLSPHDPNVLYATGNHVFRSTDEGSSWQEISPDLTRNDKSKMQPSGGPITKDNVGTEHYGTIFAFAESSLERGLFWAGSDDGLVHLSRDNGETWQNVTPPELPEWALISIIEPSPHDPATVYVAATCYKLDDFQPYLYKTHNYGKTWSKITTGIPDNDFTRVIREDPARRGLLYAGTETGVYVSFDDGAHWQPLKLNLPPVPVHDLVVKDGDLVAATHGRSFWILDDLSPLRQLNEEVGGTQAHLFAPRPTMRFLSIRGYGYPAVPGKNYRHTGILIVAYRQQEKPSGEKVDKYLDAGQNPPKGVIVHYYLHEKPEGEITLSFLDAEGKEIKKFSSKEKEKESLGEAAGKEGASSSPGRATLVVAHKEKKEPHPPKEGGANRFVWNMRYSDPVKIEGYGESEEFLTGPLAPPGTYQVQLKVGDHVYTEAFEIRKDPRTKATQEDLQAQFDLLLAIRDKLSQAHEAVNTVRSIRQQIEEWERRVIGTNPALIGEGNEVQERVTTLGKTIKKKLSAIEEELIQVKAKDQLDVLDYPIQLSAKFVLLSEVVSSADAAPTHQSQQVFEDLSSRLDRQLQQLRELVDTDVATFNQLIRESSVPAIVPTTKD